MDMDTAKNVAIAVVLFGTAIIVYLNRERLLRKLKPVQERDLKRLSSKKGVIDAFTEISKSFLMYADDFHGLYEPMFKASVGSISHERKKNVLMEWDIRMNNISHSPISLRSWWSTIVTDIDKLADYELQERAQQVVQMIMKSGIIRDDRKEFIAVQETNLYYLHSDNTAISAGQRLHVESPCWYYPCAPVRIIEKGYCETL